MIADYRSDFQVFHVSECFETMATMAGRITSYHYWTDVLIRMVKDNPFMYDWTKDRDFTYLVNIISCCKTRFEWIKEAIDES